MALIWSKHSNGSHYEVRSAGATRRLYTNGVLHSQYNPRSGLSGSVWDLLMLPAFLRPPGAIRRVLVLGVGGGAVIRELLRFVGPEAIVGVELDPVHLQIARRFFGLRRPEVTLHRAEARAWLEDYDGPPFDMIIEDAFGGRDREPERAIPADAHWFSGLLRRLTPEGVLVMNFVSREALRGCAYYRRRDLAARFATAFELGTPVDENKVGVFLRAPSDSRTLRSNLIATPGLNPQLRSSPLRYRIRRI
jgi:spermidine synthase